MSNTYEHIIPAALGTKACIYRVADEDPHWAPVVAWASVNGGPLEALVDVNDSGELTPISTLKANNYLVFTDHATPYEFTA